MFTSVFGISIKYEAWNHQDSLPVYIAGSYDCLLYTSPSPRDPKTSRMPSSA